MKLITLMENRKRPYQIKKKSVWGNSYEWIREGGDLSGSPVFEKSYEATTMTLICSDMKLTSFEGAPPTLKNFYGRKNDVVDLKGSPSHITQYFIVDSCHKLVSLNGAPKYVGYCVGLDDCISLKSLVGVHEDFEYIHDIISLQGVKIEEGGVGLLLISGLKHINTNKECGKFHDAVKIISKYLKKENRAELIYDCQKELIDAGLEAYAEI